MSKAVGARIKGDDYQACIFWTLACRLFYGHSKIERIGYEYNQAKSLDDVVIFYETPILGEYNDHVNADYYQIKYHVTQGGSFSWQDLIDPSFINATSVSFLQRVHDAQKKLAPEGKGVRFYFVSPWQVHPDNELAGLISNTGGELRLDKLFAGGKKSKMGIIREEWKQHLGLTDDDELRKVIAPIRIIHSSDNMGMMIQRLNESLICAGLKPIEAGTIVNPYVSLIKGLLVKEETEFTKDRLLELCKNENLWIGHTPVNPAIQIGIRSFCKWAENMEDETKHMLCLLEHFDERYIKEDAAWNDQILKNTEQFLTNCTRESIPYHLHLDTHSSIAFAAGYFLDSKSGVDVAPIQRYKGRHVWKPDESYNVEDYPGWQCEETMIDETAQDIAITLGVRHGIIDDVNYFIEQKELAIKKIINCTVGDGPGGNVIRNGTHAWILADKIATIINSRSFEERKGRLHIFVAVPNALIFFIGQHGKSFGPCTLYEYDFENRTPGGYISSISLPPIKKS
ncbi:SAVED domain-containing protein [Bacillus albus]|uniref:SAVED domain-containing protein n=1 Tax=Bacillus albus TaxID=2026189 RepID=UPI0014196EB9|nr:SAVED domain-containing protein [Bacillus albus]